MPQSYIEYSSGLTATTFSVPFKYLNIDDVNAIGFNGINWTPLTIATRSESANTITLSAAPSVYNKIRVYRQSTANQLVDFQAGARLTESELDTAYNQSLFVAQEVSEDANTNQFQQIRDASTVAGNSLSNFASQAFTANSGGTQTEFSLTAFTPETAVAEAFLVSIDGVIQSPTDAYTISRSPAKLTLTSAAPANAKVVIVTTASAAGASSNLFLTADGSVGIGTTSPQATLHVKDIASTHPCILVEGASPSEGDIAVIDGEALQIGHWSGSNFTERMSINSDGNVVVGRVSASSGAEDNGIVLRPAGEIYLARDGTSSQNHLLFINNAASSAATVGSVSTSGSATSYNTSSDYRLKEDIVEMQDSIEREKALKPVNFAWKIDGSRVDGFLAHEAQEVVPEAVTGTKDAVDEDGQPDYQGIDQSKLVPLLTKGLQEALTKIESLEARVEALENA